MQLTSIGKFEKLLLRSMLILTLPIRFISYLIINLLCGFVESVLETIDDFSYRYGNLK